MAKRLRNEPVYRRRRRTAAAGAGLVIAGAVAAIIALSAGGGSAPTAAAKTPPSSVAKHHVVVVRDGPRGTESVPILMYHVIGSPPPDAPFPGLYVTQSLFSAQMHALQAAGYHAVTMNQMWDNWHHGTPLPKGKPIVISFDNGYESQKLYALPVLRAMGWVAVENMQLSGLPFSQGGLNHTEVLALIKAGWELDTQGWNHADLVTLSPSELRFQVTVARQRIQRLYHVQADWFCYPSGHYNATVIAAVKAAGFRGSTTTWPGWANPTEDPYRLPRLRVLNGTSPATLLSLISGTHSNSPPGPAFS
ncbi:MAG TPA: polysaccharide deacetylase family protein [Solirubrobacteraceae bacterium]|jgi:peptidoglycan/xylan/chitin deacetylase (PgdA/CDA1 family)|nr:polysaccharide deacetylase family protein [Solirubrobacteraceae bacterium]